MICCTIDVIDPTGGSFKVQINSFTVAFADFSSIGIHQKAIMTVKVFVAGHVYIGTSSENKCNF
jgi:hypothetical protein